MNGQSVPGLTTFRALALALALGLPATPASAQVTFQKIYKFLGSSKGANPTSGVVVGDQEKVVYGTTRYGGTPSNGMDGRGTVFMLQRQSLTVLHVFDGTDGRYPANGLVRGPDGALYGTTIAGGSADSGTVYRLQPPALGETADEPWRFNVLHHFTGGIGGHQPVGRLALRRGHLYGTTVRGGIANQGIVYKLKQRPAYPDGPWRMRVLHHFTGGDGGSHPVGGVAIGPGGNLYGMTEGGHFSDGTVYRLNPAKKWHHYIIHQFSGGPEGASDPTAELSIDERGSLYGASHSGVFKLKRQGGGALGYWRLFQLHLFGLGGQNGRLPGRSATPVFGPDGALYGTTQVGGEGDWGVVYKLTPQAGNSDSPWNLTLLHSFDPNVENSGYRPNCSPVFDQEGRLYCTTSEGSGFANYNGAVFRILQQ